MAWNGYKTWGAAEVLTQSDFNTYIRDNMQALSEFVSYTPSWTASTTSPTIGNGVLAGWHRKRSQVGDVLITVTVGSTSTAGSGVYRFGLPSGWTAKSTSPVVQYGGLFRMNDASLSNHAMGYCIVSAGGSFLTARTIDGSGTLGDVTNANPVAPASSDLYYIWFPSLYLN